MAAADARTHGFPYNKTLNYPRQVAVNFRKFKPVTLRRYIETFDVPARPDLHASELSMAVARHFDAHLEVDEDDVLSRFLNSIRKSPALSSNVGDSGTGKRISTRRSADGDMVDIDDAMLDDYAPGPRTRGARNAAIAAAAAMENEYSDSSVSMPVRASRSASAGVASAMAAERGVDAGRSHISTRRRGNAAAMTAPAATRMATTHANVVIQDMAAGNAADDDQEVYCICQQPAHGEMIGCDNKGCKIEWFHMDCVGLDPSVRHVGTWYCPECTREREESRKGVGAGRGGAGAGVPIAGPGMEMDGGKAGVYAGVKRQGMPPDANLHTQAMQGAMKKPLPMTKPGIVSAQGRGGAGYAQVDGHGYVPGTIPAGHPMQGRHPGAMPQQHVHLPPPQHQQAQQQAQHQQPPPQQMAIHGAHGAQPMPGFQGHVGMGYVMPGMPMRSDQYHPQGDMNVPGHPAMGMSMQMMRSDGQAGQPMVSMPMVHSMQGSQGPGMPAEMYATGNPTQQTGHTTQGYNATA